MRRLTKDEYFMMLAYAASLRSTCPRRRVGAVLVADGHVVATGYNGSPSGFHHCFGEGCLTEFGSCFNTVHAEANAFAHARTKGDTLYCTDQPCVNCLKLALAHNPLIRIVCWREYKDLARESFMERHSVELVDFNELCPSWATVFPELERVVNAFLEA